MQQMLAVLFCIPFGFLTTPNLAFGQHCPPIIESYFESIALKHRNGALAIEIDYRKTGGQQKSAYQAYILAYPQSNAEKISSASPQTALDSKLAVVVHTQLATLQKNNCYRIEWTFDDQEFVALMLKQSLLDKNRINHVGGYASRLRLSCSSFHGPNSNGDAETWDQRNL